MRRMQPALRSSQSSVKEVTCRHANFGFQRPVLQGGVAHGFGRFFWGVSLQKASDLGTGVGGGSGLEVLVRAWSCAHPAECQDPAPLP